MKTLNEKLNETVKISVWQAIILLAMTGFAVGTIAARIAGATGL